MAEPIDRILSRLPGARREPNGQWRAFCPAHDDRHPSLSVGADPFGKVLLHCHAGCDPAGILRALGLTWADLVPDSAPRIDPPAPLAPAGPPVPASGPRGLGRVVAEYEYRDAAGRLLFEVVRYEPKAFRQRRPDGAGGWLWGLNGVPGVLYRLPQLLAADPAQPVFLVEGEKDADRLAAAAPGLGLVTTTNPGGAGKWRPEYSESLRGRRVVVLPDNDEPGRDHARLVARTIHGIAAEVRVLELPGLPDHGDVSDWLAAAGSGADPTDLLSLSAAAPLAAHWLATTLQRPSPAQLVQPCPPASLLCPSDGTGLLYCPPTGPVGALWARGDHREGGTEGGPPPLPDSARLPESLGADASPWLDRYIAFSRLWSPRAFDGFHEAVGLWVLSTVAARRVVLHLGKPVYTPLYIALVARTSLFAKSTTGTIGVALLGAAGLDWLRAADAATPQKFIQDLTLRLPDNFDRLPAERRQQILNRLSLAGQRGWFYEEFGQHVQAMSRRDGVMAEFDGILRRFDDCMETYEYGSIARGDDVVRAPYLALLAALTPDDLRPMARRAAFAWGNGLWPRFAFVAPGDQKPQGGRFPDGERSIPAELSEPLGRWHARLGVSTVTIAAEASSGARLVQAEPPKATPCTLGDGVKDQFYTYGDALRDLVAASDNHDFDGSYSRFPEKALRIAVLLASLENGDHVELRHWARGQAVAERWRADLHRLYAQINAGPEEPSAEDRVLHAILRLSNPTIREIAQRTRGMSSLDVKNVVDALLATGQVCGQAEGRAMRYSVAPSKV